MKKTTTNNTTVNKEVIANKEKKNMNEAKKETMVKANTPASNSIIDVVVNGMDTQEVLNEVNTRLAMVEKSVFNIALLCAYGTGVTIPTYTDCKGIVHGEATCEKPAKQADFITLVNRSSKSISRWVIAMRLVIDNGYFTTFAYGSLPFSYDKIIAIFRNPEVFKGIQLVDLFRMSARTLEDMVHTAEKKAKKDTDTKEEAGATEVENKEEETTTTESDTKEEAGEVATLTYNGKEYKVNKLAFEKWLVDNMIAD